MSFLSHKAIMWVISRQLSV